MSRSTDRLLMLSASRAIFFFEWRRADWELSRSEWSGTYSISRLFCFTGSSVCLSGADQVSRKGFPRSFRLVVMMKISHGGVIFPAGDGYETIG